MVSVSLRRSARLRAKSNVNDLAQVRAKRDLGPYTELQRCNMNDESGFTPKSPLFRLPLELRNMIYRYLHLNARPIGYASGARDWDDDFGWDAPNCRFSSAALRVCRQWYNEGSAVLYGENTFAFKIWEKYGKGRAPFIRGDSLEESAARRVPIKKMKKYEIIVEIQGEEEFWPVSSLVRKTCQVLCETPNLQQLKISLEVTNTDQSCNRVLEHFALLRNVRSVSFNGVSPRYAQYLKSLMEGSAPLDHLPKMYQALQNFAGYFDYCENDLQSACDAMEECDGEKFKHIRKHIMKSVETHMDFYRRHLFDHDKQIENGASGEGSSRN